MTWSKTTGAGFGNAAGSPEEAIAEFWEFWTENADVFAQSIPERTLGEWASSIGSAVEKIHPDLQWEFGPGHQSEHYFCVSSGGDTKLRVLAERWVMAAPARDETWEFWAARPGGGLDSEVSLTYADHNIDVARLVTVPTMDERRRRVDVVVHHPVFATMPEQAALNASFILLDMLLGEDDVERCIDVAPESPDQAVSFDAILESVAPLRTLPESWTLLEGTRDGSRILATVNFGIKRIDHLFVDLHAIVTMKFDQPDSNGFPSKEESEALDALEDELLEGMAPEAVHIARVTSQGTRELHFHVAAQGAAMTHIDEFARTHGWHVEARHDPTWEALHVLDLKQAQSER